MQSSMTASGDRSPIRVRWQIAPGWLEVVLLAFVSYLGIHFIANHAPPAVSMFVLHPVFWLIPGSLAAWRLREHISTLRNTNGLLVAGTTIALGQLGFSLVMGVLLGFGRTPYYSSVVGLLKISWYVAALLVAREAIRWYLVRSLSTKNEALSVFVPWVLLTLTSLSPFMYRSLTEPANFFEFTGKYIIPVAMMQFIATYLMLRGGPMVSLSYIGILTVFEWTSPILPDLTWSVAALSGVIIPLIGLMSIQSAEELHEAEKERIGPSPSIVVAAAVIMMIFWLNTGVLGVKPTLVYGISMQPQFHTGDLVVARDTPVEELKVGDILYYHKGSREIMHRIIEIRNESGHLTFITQGDNMPAPDSPVSESQVAGKLVLHIPKIGLPVTYARELISGVTN